MNDIDRAAARYAQSVCGLETYGSDDPCGGCEYCEELAEHLVAFVKALQPDTVAAATLRERLAHIKTMATL